MDEEIKKPEETTAEDTGEGSESKTATEADKLDAENERLEKAIKKKEELTKKKAELEAGKALGGDSEAGQKPAKPKELSNVEYKDAIMRGEIPEKK